MDCKKLIEVAMPIKEISAESVRDKSIRHGHISTLHLWWARRPLPVCRAVVFASLVPDPLDENCPQEFKDAVKELLCRKYDAKDVYQPYNDIPFTAAIDPMDDNLRNRLLMFIGKFSDKFISNEQIGKKTPTKDKLSNYSLIKWDNKNNEYIINIARKLIWVGYDPKNNTLSEFDKYYFAIKQAEQELYAITDRHLESEKVKEKSEKLEKAIDDFLNRMPKVFDPFAGGGAIPLETARVGCRSYANDINPVAHIIQKASLEFPQKYGKPITYSKEKFIKLYGKNAYENLNLNNSLFSSDEANVTIENRLAYDVEFYSKRLLNATKLDLQHIYYGGNNSNIIGYYWSHVGICSNPTCKAEVPLLKQFYLVKKANKKIYLNPIIEGNKISFEIKKGKHDLVGWVNRGNLRCPCCNNTTDVNTIKSQFVDNITKEKMLALIIEKDKKKAYTLPSKNDIALLKNIPDYVDKIRPQENMQRNSGGGDTFSWGITKWGELFTNRQLLLIDILCKKLELLKKELNIFCDDYKKAIVTYLAILIDKAVLLNTRFGRWNVSVEAIAAPFSRQAIPMMLDYPEPNPFSNYSGGIQNLLTWINRYIVSESNNPFIVNCINSESGDLSQFEDNFLTATITDPPYYDAIAYADISDFFYIWLKKTLWNIYPLNFAYPQTPKTEECTALRFHHGCSAEKAKIHFENKLLQIFKAVEKQTSDVVSIMFAHQSTEAWTTLCNSILGANMNITSSWAIDTEREARLLAITSSALASSITVTCKPSIQNEFGEFREIKKSIEQTIKDEVNHLYRLGFRGADLLTACFGKSVSEFGKYKKVEKSDGTEVTVAELLALAREAAFNAIISDIDTDDYTKFYIGWLNLFGFTEVSHDDVRRITQIGLNIDTNELLANTILLRNGNVESLAPFSERIKKDKKLGEKRKSYTIDIAHKMMYLFSRSELRRTLLLYINENALNPENQVWRVLNSLAEILPAGCQDHKLVSGLLVNKDNLIKEAVRFKKRFDEKMEQLKLEI